MIIAIDGPAGSGKSSTARTVASRLNALYIDTGAMYRAVALYCLDNNVSAETVVSEITLGLEQSADGVNVFLNGKNVSARIRSQEVSDMSSQVSQIASVRDLMVNQQRALAAKATSEGGTVVMEGRDIGTVVFPSADYKFFLVADPRVRAERRVAQLKEKGEDAEVSTLLSEIIERDKRDEGREHSPLRKASDAIEIDTSGLLFEDQVDKILGVISGNEG
ncbi:MAG: (d)CMP kinase [Bacteroidetes Order II. Incertae sedis bacterium]|nr:(d)CMP kinase [Bacteroidetes Order II. bacterium]MDG1754934.1 (d)CMP kinase [Rhodothermales bacterium]HAY36687.1 (d)CMP kinase [Bacteroidota bacterium]MBT5250605.1 (d)CMP kinase [Bacteroidetes Order II. bacterium]MBT6201283.1 (d)CMP kinase [Bacteroidetes Order II. bacterium]